MTTNAMLQGLRIVDLTTVVFGPYSTQTLADMGAEVIKVEGITGDIFRYAGHPAHTPGMGPGHMTLNRGKASIVLDLKTEADKEVMRELLATADVFIHNVRTQAIERLGFGYEDVKALKPDIIYVHCVGFGSDGPYADLQAYDDLIQAATGTTSLLPRVDGNPKPRYMASLIADKVAGLHGVYAVLGAMVHKLRTGEGQHVEVPMLEAFTQFILKEHLYDATFVPPTGSIGYERQIEPNRQPFPTKDGHIAIVPYTDASMVRLFKVLGGDTILAKPEFATPQERAKRQSELYRLIGELTPARTSAEWCELLHAAELPALPACDLTEVTEDPHLKATGYFRQRTHPSEGEFLEMRPPVRFSALPDPELGFAPLLNQDGPALRAQLAKTKD
jgi:crotonobetainyl-CoA:carnitine CoA-transferase CaiB-like acyl-CoA transferase